MKIRITILPRVNSQEEIQTYIVSAAAQCRDSIDRSACEEALRRGRVVAMGCVIAEPIKGGE